MNATSLCLAVLLVSRLIPLPSYAQSADTVVVPAGTLLRVGFPDSHGLTHTNTPSATDWRPETTETLRWLDGTLVGTNDDFLTLQVDDERMIFPYQEISRVEAEVAVGNSTKTGLVHGLLVGEVLGVLGAVAFYHIGQESENEHLGILISASALSAGALGAGIGAAIGLMTVERGFRDVSIVNGSMMAPAYAQTPRFRISPWIGVVPSPSDNRTPAAFGVGIQSHLDSHVGFEVRYARSMGYETVYSYGGPEYGIASFRSLSTKTIQSIGYDWVIFLTRLASLRPYAGIGVDLLTVRSDYVNTIRENDGSVSEDRGEWSDSYLPFTIHFGIERTLTRRLDVDARVSQIHYWQSEMRPRFSLQLGVSMSLGS